MRFTRENPRVRLLVRTGHSKDILESVAHGGIAVGLIRELRDSRVRARFLYEDELRLVARADDPDGRFST